LTVGAAFDYAQNYLGGTEDIDPYYDEYYTSYGNVLAAGVYATFKATDKLSFNARGEYVYGDLRTVGYDEGSGVVHSSADGFELTGTLEYDLWANVVSRLELRWDHASHHYDIFSDYLDHTTSVGFYANVIYKF